MIKAKLYTEHLPYPEKEDRKIWIYVPEHNQGDKLPVVYMFDGQNLFDENSTPYGSWDVIKAIELERQNGSKGAVIVGTDNGNIWRDSELTPESVGEVQHKEYFNEYFTPQGEIFDGFMMNTVIPFVEKNYPVLTDKNNVAICGSSSGGLMSFFTGIEHSEKFGIIGAFSPAFLCYTNEAWRSYLLNKITDDMPYLYIYTGAGDELEKMIYDSTELMYELLPEVGYPYDMINEIIIFEAPHNEAAWRDIFKDFIHTFLNR